MCLFIITEKQGFIDNKYQSHKKYNSCFRFSAVLSYTGKYVKWN